MKRLIILLTLMLVFVGCEKTISIPESAIQNAVNKKFPMEINLKLLTATLSNPRVNCTDDGVTIKLDYTYGNEVNSGVIDVSAASLFYMNGEFYIRDFNINDITFNEKRMSNTVLLKTAVVRMVNYGFDIYPIYKLDSSDVKQKWVKGMLQSVNFQENNIAVTIGL